MKTKTKLSRKEKKQIKRREKEYDQITGVVIPHNYVDLHGTSRILETIVCACAITVGIGAFIVGTDYTNNVVNFFGLPGFYTFSGKEFINDSGSVELVGKFNTAALLFALMFEAIIVFSCWIVGGMQRAEKVAKKAFSITFWTYAFYCLFNLLFIFAFFLILLILAG